MKHQQTSVIVGAFLFGKSGGQYPSPDMVGYKGQSGAWTDNETDPVTTTQLKSYSPALWTGERYYDPAYARHLSRQTYKAQEQGISDTQLLQQYAGAPNPLA